MMCREAGGEDALRGWDVGSPLLLMPRKKKNDRALEKGCSNMVQARGRDSCFLSLCPLYEALGCPGRCLNIWVCLWRSLCKSLAFGFWSLQCTWSPPPMCVWASHSSSRAWAERGGLRRARSLCLAKAWHLLLAFGSQSFRGRLDVYCQLSQPLKLSGLQATPLVFRGFQLADSSRLWGFSASRMVWANSL